MAKSVGIFRILFTFFLAGLAAFFSRSCLAQGSQELPNLHDRHTLGVIHLSEDTLDFGIVNFGASNALSDTLLNIGSTNLVLSSITSTNGFEFSILGNFRPRIISGGGSGDVYTVTFTPKVKIPGEVHLGTLTFVYDGGQIRTVTFIGREHTVLNAALRIDTGYYEAAGGDLVIHQFLITDLSGTVLPVTQFKETIQFNPNILSLTSVSKGSIVQSAVWILASTMPALGQVSISLTSSGAGLGGPGILCDLHFHVNPTAKEGDTTFLPQSGVSFGGGSEPTISVDTGKFHVSGSCVPVGIAVGNIATSSAQNSPNPVSGFTTIRYWLNEATTPTHVRILLYDQLGKCVRILRDTDQPNGSYAIQMDSNGLNNGLYFYTFEAGNVREVKRMIISK